MIRFKRKFPWIGRSKKNTMVLKADETSEPLREFVYLDEVSLSSLLASQKGEITENITMQMGNEQVAEASARLSTSSSLPLSSELNSRFQTTNSNALQTLRKATAQSLFRELHKLPNIRKIQPVEFIEAAESVEDLFSDRFSSATHNAKDLFRGDLVEFKVNLSASWIFKISSMITEFSDMFDQNPLLFIDNVKFTDVYQARNANKIISKLLAGLIPVDGVVSDHVLVNYNDEKVIVHKDAIRNLDLDWSPIKIVGVTDHLAYWKDIRRILFADSEFILLCRLSKNGIQNDWNPIKAADIFKEFAPDLAKQIEVSSRNALLQSARGDDVENTDQAGANLAFALARYQEKLLGKIDHCLTESQLSELDRAIARLPVDGSSAEGQRLTFAAAKELIEGRTGLTIEPSIDLQVREIIRKNLEIPLFPEHSEKRLNAGGQGYIEAKVEDANLLDVEIVAIYW